ncbi:tripartite tricarboxylate transporter permease [Alteribacter natronophilus]|uniref:tripartite tricarboxylate transporter permease n=1 Tax=Alteribacter natronophilus TaxID=2583810 RepID=UPI00110ECE4D|nr:tripartite tricarboxylate transporter permease [Alteribacter natronophilus]TMW72845.1 C4-dicarboxylate ABC transporter permease [Alteribacter natronophilus]
MIEGILTGITNIIQPIHIVFLLFGLFIGFLGGATPGISGTMLVIILLPITYGLDPTPAFLLLTAIYATAVFSGSISAILFKTPGAPESVATVFDGYPMAKNGQAGKALGIAILSSAAGGIIGTIILIFLTPTLAGFALQFSAPEFFALAFLGLTVVASLSGGALIKGLIGVLFGLFIATIGRDVITGTNRYTFDSNYLLMGIDFIPVLIGLFAIAEVLRKFQEVELNKKVGKVITKLPDLKLFKKISGVIGRSSLLGIFVGILPGVGATTASMLSYSEAARWSKRKDKFGTGIPEGIAAPESANNAASMGAMVPLLSLGIPGSATTAVILGAFILHGIQPGPMMFSAQGDLVYTIFIGLLLVNVFIIFLSIPFIKLFSQIVKIPYMVIGPLILVFCVIGTYAVRNSIFDVWVMLGFGLLGYFFLKAKFPLAPVILGVVLGPLAEENFRRALLMGNNDFMIFFTRPISLTLIILAVISLLFPIIKNMIDKKKNHRDQAA